MNVFLVDDSALMIEKVAGFISRIDGVKIAGHAMNEQDAVQSIIAMKPDVVILDINLDRGGNGIDILKRIKGENPSPIVMMLTNYPYPQYREKCKALGAEYFFDKVGEIGTLYDTFKQLRADKSAGGTDLDAPRERRDPSKTNQDLQEENSALKQRIGELEHLESECRQAEELLQKTLDGLRRAVGTTIQVMVSAVESRDPYTSGHQMRAAGLARAIAAEMGLPQDKIEAIRMAGSIHDIGKLSIPAEILSKPTKLSEIEYSLIKEHSRQGYEMLKDVESPWPLAEIVHQHHERMDGSGYPRQLKGDEICMEARILNVADVVEAMASHRPYRAGLGIDAALNEVETNRGILYDDSVTDTCLRLFREKGFKLAEV